MQSIVLRKEKVCKAYRRCGLGKKLNDKEPSRALEGKVKEALHWTEPGRTTWGMESLWFCSGFHHYGLSLCFLCPPPSFEWKVLFSCFLFVLFPFFSLSNHSGSASTYHCTLNVMGVNQLPFTFLVIRPWRSTLGSDGECCLAPGILDFAGHAMTGQSFEVCGLYLVRRGYTDIWGNRLAETVSWHSTSGLIFSQRNRTPCSSAGSWQGKTGTIFNILCRSV